MFHVQCPSCGQKLGFKENPTGKKTRCKKPDCGAVFVIEPANVKEIEEVFSLTNERRATPAQVIRDAKVFFVRRAKTSGLIAGPFPQDRLAHFVRHNQLAPNDALSADKETWHSAAEVFPELFRSATTQGRICPKCRQKLLPNETRCPKCQDRSIDADADVAVVSLVDDSGEVLALAPEVDSGTPNSRFAPQPTVKRKRKLLRSDGVLLDFACGSAGIVGVSESGWIGWWDASTGDLVREWNGPAAADAKIAIAGDAEVAVVAIQTKSGFLGFGKKTELILIRLGEKKLAPLETVVPSVTNLVINDAGTEIAAVDAKSAITFWTESGKKRPADLVVPGKVHGICLDLDVLAVGDAKGRVSIWDLKKGRPWYDLTKGSDQKPACPDEPHAFSFSQKKNRLLTSSGRQVDNESANQGMYGAAAGGLVGAVIGGALEAAGESKAKARREKITSLRYWDLDEGKLLGDWLWVLRDHPESLVGSALSPDGERVVTLGWDDSVRAWSIRRRDYSSRVYSIEKDLPEKKKKKLLETLPFMLTLRFIRQASFAADGEHVVVQLFRDDELSVIPWPADVD